MCQRLCLVVARGVVSARQSLAGSEFPGGAWELGGTKKAGRAGSLGRLEFTIRSDQSLANRPDGRLRAVAHGDLAQDILHMFLHSLDADRQRAADLLVAQSQRHVTQ